VLVLVVIEARKIMALADSPSAATSAVKFAGDDVALQLRSTGDVINGEKITEVQHTAAIITLMPFTRK
jgi:hypothetical protein